MQTNPFHYLNIFSGLFAASAGLSNLVVIGVYTGAWIPVGIGIAAYIAGVVLWSLKLKNESFKVRPTHTEDEVVRFNQKAKLFAVGNSVIMLVALLSMIAIRHPI